MNILVNGPQGSGKSTQASLLAEKYNLNFVDSGTVLRGSTETELGETARQYMDKGELVPDEIYFRILKNYIDTKCDRSKGFVFTGFPRTLEQIPFMENDLGIKLDFVIDLKVGERVYLERMEKRKALEGRSDDTDGAIVRRLKEYEFKTKPMVDYFREQGIVADVNGEPSVEEIFKEIASKLSLA